MNHTSILILVLTAATLFGCVNGTSTPDEPNGTMANDPAASTGTSSNASPESNPGASGESSAKSTRPESQQYGRNGFSAYLVEGRIWVFRAGSKEHEEFLRAGEPGKRISRIGGGPDNRTLVGPDAETLDSYMAAWDYARPGFAVFGEEGRLWVFEEGSEGLASYFEFGEPGKRTIQVGAGPEGKTIMSTDNATIHAYMKSWTEMKIDQPGFHEVRADGRLWVFREGSEALTEYQRVGEPGKRVTVVGGGPGGMTMMSEDRETIDHYMAAFHYGVPGYAVFVEEGRLWVFAEGSDELEEFHRAGEPGKRVMRIGEGPDGMTIMSPDQETIDAYLMTR